MTKLATLQVRIDEPLKQEAEKLFEAMGLSLSEAVRLFVGQTVLSRRLPFTPHVSRSEGGTSAFGKLNHYANPGLTGEARSAWLKEQAERPSRRLPPVPQPQNSQVVIVDETVLLHYLLDDEPRAAAKARRIVASGCAQTHPETIVALATTLEDDYDVPRSLLGTVIELLADDVSLEDGAAVRLAGRLFAGNRLSFSDCLLSARNVLTGYPVETFNPALKRLVK